MEKLNKPQRQKLYEEWVNLKAIPFIQESFDVLHNIPGIGVGCTQYVPQIFNNIDVLFLGHDAHEGGDLNIETRYLKARFMHGNNCGTPVEWRKCAEWKIWNNFEKALRNVGCNTMTSDENLNNIIVSNVLFYNYAGKAKNLNNEISKCNKEFINKCMKLNGELIFDTLKPKFVICTSVGLVFNPLLSNYDKTIPRHIIHLPDTKKVVGYAEYNGIKIIGIPHTSYPVATAVAQFVKDVYLGKKMDFNIENPTSFCISLNECKELMKLIKNPNFNQWVYNKNTVVNELYTKRRAGRYVGRKGDMANIAIDLYPKGEELEVLLFSRQKSRETTEQIVKNIWGSQATYRPMSNDETRHICKTFPKSTPLSIIAQYYNEELLPYIKTYRDNKYPL